VALNYRNKIASKEYPKSAPLKVYKKKAGSKVASFLAVTTI
jgi:hypothetical protein